MVQVVQQELLITFHTSVLSLYSAMDEHELLSFPASSCPYGPPSPASFFSGSVGAAGDDDHHHQQSVLGFLSIEVPEQWLLLQQAGEVDDHLLDTPQAGDHGKKRKQPRGDGDDGRLNAAPPPAPHAPAKRRSWRWRGREPNDPNTAINHVEAERQRREKLNRGFCELRAAVPKVSRMDRASTLSDATAYIAELRRRVQQLEADADARQTSTAEEASLQSPQHLPDFGGGLQVELEVQMMDGQSAAAVRLAMPAARHRHAPARLMAALHALDLMVRHASVCRVGGVTVQDVVVDVPPAAAAAGTGIVGEDRLRAALLHMLLQESG